MDIVSNTPYRVSTIVWQPRAGSFAVTVFCKATHLLRHGESPLAPEQEVLIGTDTHWGDDPARSLRVAGDLVPQKPRADVVVVGQVFAPGRAPVRAVVARLAVAGIDKALEVVSARFVTPDGVLHEGPPFTQMPLVYERAAAGPTNPAGVRGDVRDAQGRRDVPNVLPVGAATGAAIEPVGFGPIAPTWPQRIEHLNARAAGWDPARWFQQPIPEGFDLAYFNVAPRDQQPRELREGESLVLENLHRDHPRLVTALPVRSPHAHVEIVNGASFPVVLHCDTLVIDTDRALFTLVYRGHFPIDHPQQAGRVTITQEQRAPAAAPPAPPVPTDANETVDVAQRLEAILPANWQSRPSAPGAPPERTGAGLPFGGGAVAPPPIDAGARATVSFAVPPGTPLPPPDAEAPLRPSLPPIAPSPIAPSSISTPPPRTIGESIIAAASAPEAVPLARGLREPERLSVPPPTAAPDPALDAGSGGLLAASNAAVGAVGPGVAGPVSFQPPIAAPMARAFEGEDLLLQLVWFDRDTTSWMRRTPAWKGLLAELGKRAPDPAFDDPALARDPAEIEDRREVFEILLRGAPMDAEGLRAAMNDGMRPDGKFLPALVMLSGELEIPFDEIEYLKAILPAAAWFATPGDALAGAVDSARAFLAQPGHPPAAIAEAYTEQIRKAFKQTRRSPGIEYLEGPAERTLLERRGYQKRPVFGDVFIRALFQPAGARAAVPAYLPEAAARQLPMYRRFRARLIAETALPVDQYEAHPAALRVAALGRVVPAVKH